MSESATSMFQCRARGFSYVEVLTAMVLLVVAAVPAMDALRTGLNSASFASDQAARRHTLHAKLEEVLAEPYAALAGAASDPANITPTPVYSDDAGAPNRRLVSIAPVDADDADADGNRFTGTDLGILWIRVEIQGHPESLETLTTEVAP